MDERTILVLVQTYGPAEASSEQSFLDCIYRNLFYFKRARFAFARNGRAWHNGIALSLVTRDSATDIADAIALPLSMAKKWIIFRSETDYAESKAHGPLSECMFALRGNPMMMFFVAAKPTDFSFSSKIENVKKSVRNTPTYDLMNFNDGGIFIASTSDPHHIVLQRSYKTLTNFEDWALMSLVEFETLGPHGQYWHEC